MTTTEQAQTDLVTLEVDGQELTGRKGEMIIQVTDRAGIDIPRFCYHHKLSIAANCRMCLVDVEKAPKPLPACATPIAEGMKVFTESRRAMDAQHGVMEFLLINHPLDCPICDQGGECELQDLAMGYGRSVSRFTERKRVVKDENLGSLISTDMTRCIHCTRCVRFLEEIAGTAELGGMGRGENLEISTFMGRHIQSELSGNVIDLCPVGALTNKPFRFSARAWEMSARSSIGVHDCLGSNLYYHVRGGRIMRCVPDENEQINECWLSDRDRYSHFGFRAEDRVESPRIKVDGKWQDTDWDTALAEAGKALGSVRDASGGQSLGFLTSPRATTEDHLLVAALGRALGSENTDHRLRVSDFSHPLAGRARMDVTSDQWSKADAIFLVGSNIRHDQPLLGHRVRTAWRLNNARVMDLNPVAWKFHFDLAERLIVPPQNMVETLARVAAAALEIAGKSAPDGKLGALIENREPEPAANNAARNLRDAENAVIVLGDVALNHPQGAWLRSLAQVIADALDVALCVLPGPANSQGAWLAGNVPGEKGLDARAMLEEPRKGYVLFDLEPEFDCADPALAMKSLGNAEKVVAIASFAGRDLLEVADVLLPLAPVPETDGSFVNLDNRRQWLKAAARPPENARPGWKILRMLGHGLGLEGFDFVNLNQVAGRFDEDQLSASQTEPMLTDLDDPVTGQSKTLWRIGDVPLYAGDNLVRRSAPLQESAHAEQSRIGMHPSDAERLGVTDADRLRVSQGGEAVELSVELDAGIPPGAVRVPMATCHSRVLGQAFAPIEVEGGQS